MPVTQETLKFNVVRTRARTLNPKDRNLVAPCYIGLREYSEASLYRDYRDLRRPVGIGLLSALVLRRVLALLNETCTPLAWALATTNVKP